MGELPYREPRGDDNTVLAFRIRGAQVWIMASLVFGPTLVQGQSIVGAPLAGPVTATFGSRSIPQHSGGHSGVDIAAPIGTQLVAPAPGLVMAADQSSGVFGSYVLLRHMGGFASLYAHLSRIDVAPGQYVNRGDGLGLVGLTGLTTGPHLHWGLSAGGTPLVAGPHLRDPLAYISAAPSEFDREALFRAVALGVMGALHAAAAVLGTETEEDFEVFRPGSPEREVLAIQRAANSLIARYAGG
ncbi:MAG: hypothetical protein C0506_02685 [Anaerolinea sp.]|nr:hypothetical protein [Anaerolinea sp.]